MRRSNQNFSPPDNWRSRPDYGPYPPRLDGTSRMASLFPLFPPPGSPLDPREGDHYPWGMSRERFPGGPVIFGSSPVLPYLSNPNQFLDYGATRIPIARHPGTATDASPSFSGQWNVQPPEEESKLTPEEQKRVLDKLRKEVYNPPPKWLKRRPSLYYRENPALSSSETENGKDDDGKRCAICLEDFDPKQVVTLTPCNHMFHEECIVPWVKSQGQCPVCRYTISDKFKEDPPPSRNVIPNDPFVSELMTIMRVMEQAFVPENMRRIT